MKEILKILTKTVMGFLVGYVVGIFLGMEGVIGLTIGMLFIVVVVFF